MKFLPYEKYNRYTRLSLEAVHQRLADNIEQRAKSESKNTTKPYRGQLTNETFHISRVIDYRNSFLPVTNGVYSRENGVTRIRIRMQLDNTYLVFYAIWMGLVGCTGVLAPFWAASGKGFDGQSLMPMGMFVLGYVIMIISFKVESGKAKKFLATLLDAQPD